MYVCTHLKSLTSFFFQESLSFSAKTIARTDKRNKQNVVEYMFKMTLKYHVKQVRQVSYDRVCLFHQDRFVGNILNQPIEVIHAITAQKLE